MNRCKWVGSDPDMIAYHDTEWGTPLHDDKKQFEFLSLEVMQCGLSWMTVLKKRKALNAAFDNFDPDKIANYGETKVQEILQAPGIIKSERKIRAIIKNAKAFLKIQQEKGSFSSYLWAFTDNNVMTYPGKQYTKNDLSETISQDLKQRGFVFLGPVTVYSHLQAAGVINDHDEGCFRNKELIQS